MSTDYTKDDFSIRNLAPYHDYDSDMYVLDGSWSVKELVRVEDETTEILLQRNVE